MTMGALAGFIVGYVLGTKAGPEALERLRRAWDDIRESEDFRDLVASATGMAEQVVNRVGEGDGNIADRVRSAVAGETRDAMRRRLRTVN
jgi:hypothetical protein